MKPVAPNLQPLTDWERTCLAEGYGTEEGRALLSARQRAWIARNDLLQARQAFALAEAEFGTVPLPPHIESAVRWRVDRYDDSEMRRLYGEEAERAGLALRLHERKQALARAETELAEALADLASKGGAR